MKKKKKHKYYYALFNQKTGKPLVNEYSGVILYERESRALVETFDFPKCGVGRVRIIEC